MAALYFVAVLMLFPFASNAEEKTVKSGDDVTLQCQNPSNETFTTLEWSRPDLETDSYVFFFRDDQSRTNYQHPSFLGRVQLRDPEMKNGDVSVILKNVNINDAGTYKCHGAVNGKGPELINTINLKVEDSGHTAGNTEGHKDGGDTAYFERYSAAGDKDGGDKDGGDKDGGDKDGGDKDGGDKDGGDKDGGDKDGNMRGHDGLVTGLSVVGVFLVIAGVLIYRKPKSMKQNSGETSDVNQV